MSNPQIRTLPTPICLDDFEVGVTLGTGSFGRVRFATHKVCRGLYVCVYMYVVMLFIYIYIYLPFLLVYYSDLIYLSIYSLLARFGLLKC